MLSRIFDTSAARRNAPTSTDRPEAQPKPAETTPVEDTFEAAPPAADPTTLTVEPPAPGVSGEVTENGGSVSGTAGAGVSASRGPVSIGAGVEVEANFASEVTREDGQVTFSVSAEVSATAEGNLSVDAKSVSASLGASHTEANSASYQVTMSEEDFERFQAGEIPVPTPTDPSTIPDGATVRLDTAQIGSDELNASVGYHGAELSVGASGSESEGTTVEVTRNGDQLQVSTGPTAAYGTGISAGISVGPVSTSAGNDTSFEQVELKTATFDLGSEAYDRYLNTGELPEQNGDGVSNVGTIIREDYNSQSSVGVTVAGQEVAGIDGASTTGTRTAFIGADGTTVEDISLRYDGATLNIHNEYTENGKQYDKSTHELVFPETDEALRYDLALAFTGDEEQANELAQQDGPLTIEFNLEQLADLRRRLDELPEGTETPLLSVLADAKTNDELAVALAQASGNNNFITDLARVSYALADEGGTGNLPGSVDVG